jgi:hypothetical protein
MKPGKGFWLYTILICHSFYLEGQQLCSFDEIHQHLLLTDPQYKKEVSQLNQQIYDITKSLASSSNKSRGHITYTLPVVVHIITPPGTATGQLNNLTDFQVLQGLNYLNQSFANQDTFYSPDGIDIGIQFCLAKRDPNGMPTSGITRNESNFVNDTMCSPGTNSFYDKEIKSLSRWDCENYINVWLVTDLFNSAFNCGLAAYAYFPGVPCQIDGIVVESRYWNSIHSSSIVVHEFGHYLSLEHTFNDACQNVDCLLQGDRICDTPPDNSAPFAPCDFNSCHTDIPDVADDNSNFMDYSSCKPKHFTEGQHIRMVAALESRRSGLIKSKACQQTLNYDVSIIDISFKDFCSDTICPEIVIRNEGLKFINSVFISFSIDGQKQQGFDQQLMLNTNQTVKVSLPCFYNATGVHVIEVLLGDPDNNPDLFSENNLMSLGFDSYSTLRMTVDKIIPTHCASDGIIAITTTGGLEPYTYKINSVSYFQADPYFQLLLPGNYTISVTDAHLCAKSIEVTVPDSCKSFRTDDFRLNKDAHSLGNGCYLLTTATPYQVGSVWYQYKVDLNESFDLDFDLNLGCLDLAGADGAAFVLQPVSTTLGVAGGGMGYQGIAPSLVVEFDTWQNKDLGDPVYDHMSLMKNGNIDHLNPSENLKGPVSILLSTTNAEDCNFHKVTIHWDSELKNFLVKVDCEIRINYTGDIIKNIFGGDPNMYFGFTAATGGSVNVHQICFNYISTINKIENHLICKGSSVQLSAAPNFRSYKWTPVTGLNKNNIRNPVFNPDTSTTYYLEQIDGCGTVYLDTFTIDVKELKLDYTLERTDSCGVFYSARIKIKYDPFILYSINGVDFLNDSIFNISQLGNYTLYARIGDCMITKFISITDTIKKFADSIILIQAASCKLPGAIIIDAIGGIPPYAFSINNGTWQSNGFFSDLNPGMYLLEIRDHTSCILHRTIEIKDFINKFKVVIDSAKTESNCCMPEPFLIAGIEGIPGFYYFSLDHADWTPVNQFGNLSVGLHTINAKDETGCLSDTLNIFINSNHKTYKDSISINLCQGDSIRIGNEFFARPGNYIIPMLSRSCCDSTIFLDLRFNDTIIHINSLGLCEGDSIRVATHVYYQNGLYMDTLVSRFGCDSIEITQLNLYPKYEMDYDAKIC